MTCMCYFNYMYQKSLLLDGIGMELKVMVATPSQDRSLSVISVTEQELSTKVSYM